ncbi:hypothetical protein U9M48_005044 [Paspalum notatum var. saurae]|uniref:Uncharacterized protein n=1 Tax=Paspalum notatum var. saurae TaxID=547442 RepID=A0AAQ3PLI2_PASNO
MGWSRSAQDEGVGEAAAARIRPAKDEGMADQATERPVEEYADGSRPDLAKQDGRGRAVPDPRPEEGGCNRRQIRVPAPP